MHSMLAVVSGIVSLTMGVGSPMQAQSGCPSRGSELVYFGAGGRNQGGAGTPRPPRAASDAPGAAGGAQRPEPPSEPDLPPQGLYAGCLDEKTGHLTLLGIQAKVNRASWVLVDPKKSVIYTTGNTGTAMNNPGSVFSFKIDRPTGSLTPLGSTASGGSDPTHLAWDPRSATLFVANHGEGIVGVVKTDADGGTRLLSDKAQQEGSGPNARQKNAAAHGLAVDPTGHYVLCADFGSDKIYVYRYDAASGKLSPSSPAFLSTPPGTGPRHITFSPDGKYVVMNTELDGKFRGYGWNASTGSLSEAQVVDPFPADFQGVRSAAELQFSPDGKFLYGSLRGKEDKLLVYQWNGAEGKMTETQRIPSLGGTPWSFRLDPSGKWLLVANSGSGSVSIFSVDRASGKLDPVGDPVKLQGVITVDFLAR